MSVIDFRSNLVDNNNNNIKGKVKKSKKAKKKKKAKKAQKMVKAARKNPYDFTWPSELERRSEPFFNRDILATVLPIAVKVLVGALTPAPTVSVMDKALSIIDHPLTAKVQGVSALALGTPAGRKITGAIVSKIIG